MGRGNPNPSPETRFKPGHRLSVGHGRPRKPDVEKLNDLIARLAADEGIARTWLMQALGDPKKGLKPDYNFFKMLLEYRNGKVPQPITFDDEDLDEPSATDENGKAIEP